MAVRIITDLRTSRIINLLLRRCPKLLIVAAVFSIIINVGVAWTLVILDSLHNASASSQTWQHCENDNIQFVLSQSFAFGKQRMWLRSSIFYGARNQLKINPIQALNKIDFEDCIQGLPKSVSLNTKLVDVLPKWCINSLQGGRAPVATSSRSTSRTEVIDAYGWPFLTMTQQYDYDEPKRLFIARKTFGKTVELRGPNRNTTVPNVLPMHPIWLGLVINTSLYYAAIAIAYSLCHFLLCRRRLRDNQCMQCRYCIVGIRGGCCPECGFPVR